MDNFLSVLENIHFLKLILSLLSFSSMHFQAKFPANPIRSHKTKILSHPEEVPASNQFIGTTYIVIVSTGWWVVGAS
jgi:hypothetical protein